jgi:hypothetical protein
MPDALFGDPLLLVAVAGLGLSGIVSAIRLIDWFMHSDPKVIAQASRWGGLALAALSVPLLLGLLIGQRWTAAAVLAAVMLLGFTFYGPRALARLRPLRPDLSWPPGGAKRPDDPGMPDDALVQRSIAVLEAYLQRTTGIAPPPAAGTKRVTSRAGTSGNGNGHDLDAAPMPVAEALDVLQLDPGATETEINDAHRRLIELVHPDRGGSHYLTVKINQAKDTLLGAANVQTASHTPAPARKPARRRASARPQPPSN